MADETTPTTDAPVADTAPTPPASTLSETPQTEAAAEPTPAYPAATPDPALGAVLQANVGTVQAQVPGPPAVVNDRTSVEESFLDTDHVITDHNDPNSTRFQFLGLGGNEPLPLAGANGDARKPEEKLSQLGA